MRQPSRALMSRSLQVTNVAPTTSPRDLCDLFSQDGYVAASRPNSGESRDQP
jgi:hypothetical protein